MTALFTQERDRPRFTYLRMTGGQESLLLGAGDGSNASSLASPVRRVDANRPELPVARASDDEIAAHDEILQRLGDACVWHSQ